MQQATAACNSGSRRGMPVSKMPESNDPTAMMQTLLDRMQIQDLFTRYYTDLDGSDAGAFGKYFVENAELDVNGIVVRGEREIADLYRRVAADKPPRTGTFRMILSNAQIEVTGTTATARLLWTQLLNDSLKGPPQLIEQGREIDTLIKRDGQWRITKRVVTADSGLPDLFDETYRPR
jgi:hypothetical protein